MFTNPITTNFDLQHNTSYNSENASSPILPVLNSEQSHTPSNNGSTDPAPSILARLVDNPRYGQLSSSNVVGAVSAEGGGASNGVGVVSDEGGVASTFEGDYDYPTTFRTALSVNSDPYSHVITTSGQDEPDYATIQ